MQVGRFEFVGKDGKTYGPFSARWKDPENELIYQAFIDGIAHLPPDPEQDGIPQFNHAMICGFLPGYQADRWTAPHWLLRPLLDKGMRIALYEVPHDHLHQGKTQVAWIPNYGTLIRELTIEEFFDFGFEWPA